MRRLAANREDPSGGFERAQWDSGYIDYTNSIRRRFETETAFRLPR